MKHSVVLGDVIESSEEHWSLLCMEKPFITETVDTIVQHRFFEQLSIAEQQKRERIELALVVLDHCFNSETVDRLITQYRDATVLAIYACIEHFFVLRRYNVDILTLVKVNVGLSILTTCYPRSMEKMVAEVVDLLELEKEELPDIVNELCRVATTFQPTIH